MWTDESIAEYYDKTPQEKKHTLELSEQELAAILFLLTRSNGKSTFQVWKRCKDILVESTDNDDFEIKHKLLSGMCGYDDYIDYYSVEKEWETFLGIVDTDKAKLDKIAMLERELSELKGIL